MKPRSQARRTRRERLDMVNVDFTKLQWHIQRTCKSKSAFADHCGIGRTSLHRIELGQAVQRSTVQQIASTLGISIDDLLEATEVTLSPEEQVSPWKHPEWQVVPGTLSALRVMSNGLVMRVAKVRHRLLENEFGRAKLYDIAGMPAAVREQCRQALIRHAVVCRRLAQSPFIATNLTMTALEEQAFWTAVDVWCEGTTLADELAQGPLSLVRLREVMTQVGTGIEELHAQHIVLRELHPQSILVRDGDRSCLLTDLELAKLLEVEATVSSTWQINPYRAPEVAAGEARPQADIYSFARLCAHLLLGTLPDFPDDVDALQQLLRPSEFLDRLVLSLSPNWKRRPGSIRDLLSFLPQLENRHG